MLGQKNLGPEKNVAQEIIWANKFSIFDTKKLTYLRGERVRMLRHILHGSLALKTKF